MTRPRTAIKVFVAEKERALITDLAKSANLSLSAYLRAAGLNQKVRSAIDVHAVNELAKVNGELGRTADLLKKWLDEGNGARWDVERLMKEIRELQKQSHEIMGRMVR